MNPDRFAAVPRRRWLRMAAGALAATSIPWLAGCERGTERLDHSAQTYLIDAQGRLRIVLKHEQSAEDYAHDIAWLLREGGA